MPKTRSKTLIGLGILGLLAPAGLADATADEARATAVFQMLATAKYADFAAAGTPQMQAAMDATKSEQLWRQLGFQLGEFRSVLGAKFLKAEQGLRTVVLRAQFERGVLSLNVVLDGQDRLAGLWVAGIEAADTGPPPYADKTAFDESPVEIRSGVYTLPGTVSVPHGEGPWPAVVLVHGSGPHDQDETVVANKPLRDLAWGLASRGVAVVRYEKRTKKYGMQVNPATLTLREETIDDACAAAALLRETPRIDAGRVFVLGHSLGGMAAPLIAEQDGRLAGAILVAGNARPLAELVVEQLEYLSNLDGDIDADEQAQIDAAREFNKALADHAVGDDTPAVLGAPAAYWERLSRVDQLGVAARIDTPLLILQGARDYQVTKADFDLWRQRLAKKSNATFKLYDDLNHLMMTGKGKSTPAEYTQAGHVAQQVVDDVADWIKRQPPTEGK